MNLAKILRKVGTSIVRDAVPGGGMLIDTVNGFLPGDKKLPKSATGEQMSRVIESLPESDRAALLSRELDVEETHIREQSSVLQAVINSDVNNPQTTRPQIALGAFRVVAFCTIAMVSVWAVAVLRGDDEMVLAINEGYVWVAAILIPFIGWLNLYFGKLTSEHKNKLNAASGAPPSGVSSIITALIKR